MSYSAGHYQQIISFDALSLEDVKCRVPRWLVHQLC